MRRFARFACIDWSGARGEALPGLALAVTDGDSAVAIAGADRRWSRASLYHWLADLADSGTDMLVGLDLSPAFPFADTGAYFPGWDDSPADAPALWALVDRLCRGDPHFGVDAFLSHRDAARHFRQRGSVGDAFPGGRGRLRQCEIGQAAMRLNPTSCFNLVGAAQVGKSSLTGMRVLNRLRGRVPVWPFDPVPDTGPMIVEIYTSLAARVAGIRPGRSKTLDGAALAALLDRLGATADLPDRLSDHASDALLTAAWLRRAAGDAAHWSPAGLATVAATEGWTFGVV